MVLLLAAVTCFRLTSATKIEIQPSLFFTNEDGSDKYPPGWDDLITQPIVDTMFTPQMTEFIRLTATKVCWSGLWRFYPLPYWHGQPELPFYGFQLVNNGHQIACSPLSSELRQALADQRSVRSLGCDRVGEVGVTDASQKCISMYAEEHAGGQVVHYDQARFDGSEILNLTIPVKSFYMSALSDSWDSVNSDNKLIPVVKTFSGPGGDNGAGRRSCIVMDGVHPNDPNPVAKHYYQPLVEEGSNPFISIRGREYSNLGANCASPVETISVPPTTPSKEAVKSGVITIYAT